MKIRNFLAFFVILGFAFLVILRPTLAQEESSSYPAPQDDYVNDFAEVISEGDETRLQTLFSDLEKKTGIEAVAVTIKSVSSYNTGDSDIEPFATNLFNAWGIGHKSSNNGILILVSVEDRAVRIELGDGYGDRYNSQMQRIIDNNMLPYFKEGDYSRGIYEGSRSIVTALTVPVPWYIFYKWHMVIGFLIILFIIIGISLIRSGKKGWGWAFLVATGGLLLLLLRMFSKGKSSKGFGGGSSSGSGGATGRW